MSFQIEGEEWLTMQEAADELGKEYQEVANLVHYHRALDSMKVGAGRVIRKSSVVAYKQRTEKEAQDVAA